MYIIVYVFILDSKPCEKYNTWFIIFKPSAEPGLVFMQNSWKQTKLISIH